MHNWACLLISKVAMICLVKCDFRSKCDDIDSAFKFLSLNSFYYFSLGLLVNMLLIFFTLFILLACCIYWSGWFDFIFWCLWWSWRWGLKILATFMAEFRFYYFITNLQMFFSTLGWYFTFFIPALLESISHS